MAPRDSSDSEDEKTKTSKVKVKVFEGKDFHVWKRRMVTDLKGKGLWGVVKKSIPNAAASNAAADVKAYNALVLADQFLSTITVEMTAKEAWDKLVALKLTRVLQEKDESIQAFKARLMRVLEELTEDFDPVITSIELDEDLCKNLEEVTARLMDYEENLYGEIEDFRKIIE
ncbi:hypothetical protein HDU96_010726 [Phlyctochytrium bullatum]|nr:hypothetical protein HDU96_010726 [Phlyctochytrium bullatum]